ncbi:MAG: hypothetical protein U1F68_01855 [Gammaproteobacteria bacterium]
MIAGVQNSAGVWRQVVLEQWIGAVQQYHDIQFVVRRTPRSGLQPAEFDEQIASTPETRNIPAQAIAFRAARPMGSNASLSSNPAWRICSLAINTCRLAGRWAGSATMSRLLPRNCSYKRIAIFIATAQVKA